ncbi:fimbrial protein SefA [Salmonella enterica subsp. enterica serovar Reading]|nr:fimbrial protein SefA [Salmonella enterica subsp. enterica serovar Eko]EBA4418566.1 fimbrial protein SefA [Salmonella enterica]EBS2176306.1 fimbrial protein SefA [Salmonella enterica subsp. enterica serovar Telelkebir]EBW7912790.1 fimbrial protein SefA [Salmonella enterica subsp. enterica serovar Richmond]ECA3871950.1 fimbrial protein SefA [Salmonella enterica subsp. enterica serovar Bispebjerg]ECG7354721.1 fimbrial protein SefA [Salmonella enterica subsp. enterica serovar Muenchen]EDA5900
MHLWLFQIKMPIEFKRQDKPARIMESSYIMKKITLSSICMAMIIASATTQAATQLGNTAEVSAPVTIGATNTTSATWVQADSFGNSTTLTNNQPIGRLEIVATGAHDGLFISGQGARINGSNQVTVPFYSEDGRVGFSGTLNNDWTHVNAGSFAGKPGWQKLSTEENTTVNVLTAGYSGVVVAPGTYTATFEVRQYQR